MIENAAILAAVAGALVLGFRWGSGHERRKRTRPGTEYTLGERDGFNRGWFVGYDAGIEKSPELAEVIEISRANGIAPTDN